MVQIVEKVHKFKPRRAEAIMVLLTILNHEFMENKAVVTGFCLCGEN